MDVYSLLASLGRLYGGIPACTPLIRGCALPPLFLVLELTYRCNLHCPFCYLRGEEPSGPSDPGNRELTATEIESVLDQTPPWTLVLLSGGEVAVRSDFPEILRTAVKRRRCHIFTNGTLVTPALAAEWVDLGVSSVAVSVEGPEEVHDRLRGEGTFARTVAGIKLLVDYRAHRRKRLPLINLKATITAGNVGTLAETIRIAEDAGVDYCTFQVLNTTVRLGGRSLQTALDFSEHPPIIQEFPLGSLDQQLRTIERLARTSRVGVRLLPGLPVTSVLAHYHNNLQLADYTCVSPWTVAYISPYGDVYPCLNYLVGNVRQESLRGLWNSRRYRLFRQEILNRGLFPDCQGCCDLLKRN